MNIQDQVQIALNNIVESGKIEEIVAKNVEKTIESLLHDALREYSDFGKNLKEIVQSALKIDLSKISTLGYQQIVTDIVRQKLQEATLEHISKPLEETLNQIIAPFEKRTYKLSEIIDEYKKHEWDSMLNTEIMVLFISVLTKSLQKKDTLVNIRYLLIKRMVTCGCLKSKDGNHSVVICEHLLCTAHLTTSYSICMLLSAQLNWMKKM